MIGWVSSELLFRCKNAEEKVAEPYDQLEHACSGTQQQHQFKELRCDLNGVHKRDQWPQTLTSNQMRARRMSPLNSWSQCRNRFRSDCH